MMELFTLGADRGLHRERRARAGARADRLRADWSDGLGWTTSATTPTRTTPARKTIFGQTGNFDWRDSCRLCVEHTPAPALLRRQAVVVLHPDRGRRGARARRSRSSTCRAATTIGRCVEAILQHPALYTGPRMVKPPIVYIAGLLRALRPRRSTPSRWTWISGMTGQRLFYPPNVAGWDDNRWLDTASCAAAGRRRRPRSTSARSTRSNATAPTETPAAAVDARDRVLGRPDDLGATAHAAGHVLTALRRPAPTRTGSARATRACARTPCARWSRPPPTSRPAESCAMSCGCNDFTVPSSAPRRRARRQRDPRAGTRACRRPAGSGLDRRSFLLRGAGLALTVYGATQARPVGVRGRRRRGAPDRPQPVLVSIFLAGGIDSMIGARAGRRPQYRQLRPKLALPDGRDALHRGRAPALAPRRRRRSRSCTARARSA